MAQEKVQQRAPSSERQRKLQQLAFTPSSALTRELPRDTVLRGMSFRLSGNVTTTYTGTPVSDALSTFDNLISRIDVQIGGSRTVKSVRPAFLSKQQLFYSKIIGERKASAGAAAVATPTADGGFVFGTTTQVTTVAETIWMPFEMIWAYEGSGRESTWLNLKGVSSATVTFVTNAFAALQGFGNTAPVVYSANNLVIDISLQEQADAPANLILSDWKQTMKQVLFPGQTTDGPIDLNRGNSISGLWFYAQDGAAGSTTTASGKIASNLLLTKMQVVLNGQTSMKQNTWLELQAENRARFGFNVPYAANVSSIDGWAHWNFLSRFDLNTALDCRPPLVDNVQLVVNTNDTVTVSYTNSPSLTIMTDEIVAPR